MNFDKTTSKGDNYALLYPRYEENEELKKAAEEIGARSALVYDRKEKAWRLYENKVPEGANVDAALGKYTTEEAKNASIGERDKVEEMKKAAAVATGATVDESKVYYAAKTNGDYDAFTQMRKEKNSTFTYSKSAGGFVHRDGPTEGFERFQTPEAKAAWVAQYEKTQEASDRRRESASEGIDVIAERANGRVFLADNSKGFMLPSTKQQEARDSQLAAMKSASNEELAQVFKITEGAKKAIERKEYAIQVKAAQAAGVGVEDFNAMEAKDRRAAANFQSLSNEDFAKKVALTQGFFAVRSEMVDRGLVETRESAIDKQADREENKASKASAEKAPEKEPEAKAEKKAANRMAEQLAAGAMSQGVGR